jgi:Zn-dependent protease with chaperone function
MARIPLTGLQPKAYEHALDAKTLAALKSTGGIQTAVKKLNEWGFERLLRVQLTGSYLRATTDTFPDLFESLTAACATLDVARVPDLYVAAGGDINAFTAGVDKPLIVLNTSAVERLTRDELHFVIAHEVGHIKSAHVLYYQMAEFLPVIAAIVGTATFGIGEIFGVGMQAALLRWKRMSELTADRAGLLACQDVDVALTALMKLSGLPQAYFASINTEDFLAQARAFDAMDADNLNLLAKWLSTMGTTHPWTVLRAKELLAWIDAGDYQRVLDNPRIGAVQLPPGVSAFCSRCGRGLKSDDAFCPGCGTAAPKVATGG